MRGFGARGRLREEWLGMEEYILVKIENATILNQEVRWAIFRLLVFRERLRLLWMSGRKGCLSWVRIWMLVLMCLMDKKLKDI